MAIKVTGNIVIDDLQAISNITTISSNGNANLGNLGTATAIITTGNVTTINSGLLQNGNSNITLTAGGNLTFTARTVSTLVVSNTGANITGTANVSGNANVGNIGAATAELTTGNITTINSGLLQNGNSNITITAAGNLTFTARTVSTLVVSNTGANISGTANVSGNANVLNLGTSQVLATANITAPQLISNVATGTAPLVVTSTTTVSNLSVTSLQGNGPSQSATANSIVQREANGNITGNFFIGNGSQLTGISAGFPLANGTSNINIPTASGNINFSIGGVANEVVMTSTGINVNGTINATDVITGNGSGLSALNASNVSTGTLAVGRGGLGITTTPTNGQVPIGNGTTYVAAGITGTADQITVTNGAGTITLSTPQSINTSSNPQFNSLGIGTAASTTAGEIRATNNITAYYSSDIRLKENIKNIENSLELLKKIRGVNFDWTQDYINKNGGEDGYFIRKNDVGVIAQEVQAVLPQVVAKRSDDYLAVRYEKIIPLLIEAIKELSETIDELKRERN